MPSGMLADRFTRLSGMTRRLLTAAPGQTTEVRIDDERLADRALAETNRLLKCLASDADDAGGADDR